MMSFPLPTTLFNWPIVVAATCRFIKSSSVSQHDLRRVSLIYRISAAMLLAFWVWELSLPSFASASSPESCATAVVSTSSPMSDRRLFCPRPEGGISSSTYSGDETVHHTDDFCAHQNLERVELAASTVLRACAHVSFGLPRRSLWLNVAA
jgi:hypothetical protein